MLKFLILACAVSAIHAQCGFPANPPNEASLNIVGGSDAEPHTWPWMTEVIKDGGHYCGATLIDNEWIVSAAHCFERNPQLSRYQFSVGGHKSADTSESTRQTFYATKIIRHEDYSALSSSNDIALIKISGASYNDNVSPACLASSRVADGSPAYVTGWGNQETIIHDLDLQQVMVPIVNQNTCEIAYQGYNVDETMICAGYPNGGKDACQADSGGPMVVKVGGKWTLVGVVSWGVGCADAGYYGVYSDVDYLNSWIQTTMSRN